VGIFTQVLIASNKLGMGIGGGFWEGGGRNQKLAKSIVVSRLKMEDVYIFER
jgi:hypothetical protein